MFTLFYTLVSRLLPTKARTTDADEGERSRWGSRGIHGRGRQRGVDMDARAQAEQRVKTLPHVSHVAPPQSRTTTCESKASERTPASRWAALSWLAPRPGPAVR